MLFSRDYRSIKGQVEAQIADKGSRFLAHAFPVKSESEVKVHLGYLREKYPDATHNCYAWIINPDKSAIRFNDDGEPANTAGRPILKQINALDLTNILVVVVRYFGGKKLGIPGLIEAYGASAKLCLAKVEIVQKTLLDYYKIETLIEQEHLIYNLARRFDAEIDIRSRAARFICILAINGSKTELFLKECQLFNNFECVFLKTE